MDTNSAAIAYYNMGHVKYKMNNYAGAIDDFSKAISLDPDYPNAYNSRGYVKFLIQDYSGAIEDSIEDLTKAISLNSDFTLAYINRGHAKFGMNDFVGALEDYEIVKGIFLRQGKIEEYRQATGFIDELTQKLTAQPP